MNASLDRSYRFPKDEVVYLDTVNVTSEELARLFAFLLAKSWKSAASSASTDSTLASRLKSLSVTIEETRGQSATFVLAAPFTRSDVR